jgi:hypothetical protein
MTRRHLYLTLIGKWGQNLFRGRHPQYSKATLAE